MKPVVVVKLGGAAMADGASLDAFAAEIVYLAGAGRWPVVVHGGGPALTAMLERLGIESRFVDGHRVTTPEAAEVAEMVLSGRTNKEIVAALVRAGVRALGLSGTDAGMLRVARHRPNGNDIGSVGVVEAVNADPLRLLLEHGYVPVLSTTASGPEGGPYNVNADVVAGAVAAALGAERLVFLSDVPGVKVKGELVPHLDVAAARALLASGDAYGGMRPKLEAALAAVEAGVPEVNLVDGRVAGVVLAVVLEGSGSGTTVRCARGAGVEKETEVNDSHGFTAPEWAGGLAKRGGEAVMATYGRYPLELVRGEGTRVWDSSGREYLDFVSGIAVNVLGHAHPALVGAIREASSGLLHVSNLYWTEPMVRLAERLTRAAGMERAFFCNSGAEANEAALKLARKARPGRAKIVVFDHSFHGRTMGALSCTAQEKYQAAFRPLLPGIVELPFGDFASADAAIDATTAAVLVEPIQGEGGVRPAPRGWLAHLRACCDRAGALLLFDEVQTGLGRTGTLYAADGEGVAPDAIATAKALAGGLPMGALLARGEAATAFAPGDHASTFGGGPFVATVANAVLDVVLGPGFLEDVRERGEWLGGELRALAWRHPALVVEARGRGLMWGLALTGLHAAALVEELHGLGVLTVPAGKDVLRLVPPLTVTREELSTGLARMEQALTRLEARLAASAAAEAVA